MIVVYYQNKFISYEQDSLIYGESEKKNINKV